MYINFILIYSFDRIDVVIYFVILGSTLLGYFC